MFSGISLAILTGLCWTAFGAVLSFTARGKHNVVAFGIVQNLFCALVSLAFFTTPSALGQGRPPALFALIFAGGFLNSLAQFVTNRAMKQGHNGLIWAISQSSLIVPFIMAALCFAQSGTPAQWCGITLIIAGIVLPNLRSASGSSASGRALGAAFAAFLLFGTVQTLYLLPAMLDIPDPAHFRPVWAALGMTTGWMATGTICRQSLKPNRAMAILGCSMALISVSSLLLFFLAIDKLNQAGAGNIAIPLMVGSNIFFFTLFSIFKLREKNTWREWSTLALLLAGLVLLALR